MWPSIRSEAVLATEHIQAAGRAGARSGEHISMVVNWDYNGKILAWCEQDLVNTVVAGIYIW